MQEFIALIQSGHSESKPLIWSCLTQNEPVVHDLFTSTTNSHDYDSISLKTYWIGDTLVD